MDIARRRLAASCIALLTTLVTACASSPKPFVEPEQRDDVQARKIAVPLAMVMFDKKSAPSEAAFANHYEQRWGKRVTLDAGDDPTPGSFIVSGDDVHAMVVFVPVPIPWGDLENPIAAAWHWPDAEKTIKAHAAHALVAVVPSDPPNPVGDAIVLTRVVGALVASMPEAVGVYWGNGPTVASREIVMTEVAELAPDRLPLVMWLGFWPAKMNDGRVALTTRGLAQFGQLELLVVSRTGKEDELLSTLADAAHYVLIEGPVLDDGDTFGPSANDKWPIRHVRAPWNASETVIQLTIP